MAINDTDEWVNGRWYCTCREIVFSHQKESSPASGNSCMKNGLNKQWMRLEGVVLSETSQAETDRYCMISLIYGISKTEKGNT